MYPMIQQEQVIQIERATGATRQVLQAANIYAKAFSEPPYCEYYKPEDVIRSILQPYYRHYLGLALTCKDSVRALTRGFVAAHPVQCGMSSEALAFAVPLLAHPTKTIYIGELAVAASERRKGIGALLIESVKQWASSNGYPYFCTRTAAVGSNSLRLFQKAGGTVLHRVQDVRGEAIDSDSSQRVWILGETAG